MNELVLLITSIRGWSSESEYTRNDWIHVLQTAQIFQNIEPALTEQALYLFDAQNTNNFHSDYLENSKSFILLRVIFDLQENFKGRGGGGTGWRGSGNGVNPDGTINLGWPITWKSGQPTFQANYSGFEGPPYDSMADFASMRKRFKMRNLSAYLR